MYIDNFPPLFSYDEHRVIFNYAIKDILFHILEHKKEELIEHNGVSYLKFNEKSYIVSIDSETKADIFDKKNIPNLNNYHMAVGNALKNSGVFAILDGYNALELSEDLAKNSGISLDYIMDIYKKNINEMDDESKDENAKSLAALIPELYKLAIKTNQIKFDVEEVPEKRRLKGYCDSDFYIYTYKDKFFIACYASANMYLVDFKENGFVVYGHSNSYGKEIEDATTPDFEWDTAEFEPYYLKYLNDNMIIMEVKNNEINVHNSLVAMLTTIVEHIAAEECIEVNLS